MKKSTNTSRSQKSKSKSHTGKQSNAVSKVARDLKISGYGDATGYSQGSVQSSRPATRKRQKTNKLTRSWRTKNKHRRAKKNL